MRDSTLRYSSASLVSQGCLRCYICTNLGMSLISRTPLLCPYICPPRRYRLMLRRCLESPHPCFGMVPPPRASATTSSPGNEFGTMLEIRNVQMLPDGRSVVETWGSYRFRIMERGVLDGYMVGRVERVDDYADELVPMSAPSPPVEGSSTGSSSAGVGGAEGRDGATNEELMAVCREFVEQLKEGTPWVRQHLVTNYVAMPEDPAEFSFWMAPVSFYLPSYTWYSIDAAVR